MILLDLLLFYIVTGYHDFMNSSCISLGRNVAIANLRLSLWLYRVRPNVTNGDPIPKIFLWKVLCYELYVWAE